MKCSVCGRKLISPKSQAAGYGPVCYKRLFGGSLRRNTESGKISTDFMPHYEVPGQMSIDDFIEMP